MSTDSTEHKLEELAQTITGVRGLGAGLEEDDSMRSAWKKTMRLVFDAKEDYRWITNDKSPKAARFIDWRERVLAEEGLDPDTARLLVWLGAWPGRKSADYAEMSDSEGVDVCGVGPLQMTFRMASRMEITALPDALVTQEVDKVYEDKARVRQLLSATVEATGAPPIAEGELVEYQTDQVAQGRAYCLHATGEDYRINSRRLVLALAKQLGPDGDLLPQVGTVHASMARIAKFWAADITRIDYREEEPGISFESGPPGAVLSTKEARGQWALARTAETIARSVALPCMAVLSADDATATKMLGEGNLPSPINCLVLDWRLRNEE